MSMVDLVSLLVIVAIVGFAMVYIVRARRRGIKCIGCPEGVTCPSKGAPNASAPCGCSAAERMVAEMEKSLK